MMITLIGYRGCGKSSAARVLADRLGWRAVDADAEIERLAGRTIRDIFAADGEAAFRTLERTVMRDWLARRELVLAAGGGAVLNEQTRHDLKQAGPVVWLQASVETILARIGRDATTPLRRPSLTLYDLRTEVETLLAQREPLYAEVCTVAIATDGRTPDEVAADILTELAPLLRREETP